MSIAVLRRMRALVPHPITTSPAPPPACGIDVTQSPQRPADTPVPSAAEVLPPTGWLGSPPARPLPPIPADRLVAAPAAHPSLPPAPPSWSRGVCYHHAHIEFQGQRIGVLVLDDASASLLRCEHVNRDGH